MPKFQMRHNHRPILGRRLERPIPLHHKIHRQTQFAQPPGIPARHARRIPRLLLRLLLLLSLQPIWIVRDNGDIVPPRHELLVFSRAARRVRVEDFHHVFFRVGDFVGALVAVLRDVQQLVVVQHLEEVVAAGGGDDG